MSGLGLAGALLLSLVLWPSQAGAQTGDACAACHLETGDERLAAPARNFDGDIHKAKGFGCVDCHAGEGCVMSNRYAERTDDATGIRFGAPGLPAFRILPGRYITAAP